MVCILQIIHASSLPPTAHRVPPISPTLALVPGAAGIARRRAPVPSPPSIRSFHQLFHPRATGEPDQAEATPLIEPGRRCFPISMCAMRLRSTPQPLLHLLLHQISPLATSARNASPHTRRFSPRILSYAGVLISTSSLSPSHKIYTIS